MPNLILSFRIWQNICLSYYQHGFAFYCIVWMKCFCLCAELGGTLIMKLNIHSVCFQFWLFPHWSQLYTDLCPSASKLISFHLKPFLQNIVYPEAIGEIQALTDAYDAKRLQADTAAGGLPWEKAAALHLKTAYFVLMFIFLIIYCLLYFTLTLINYCLLSITFCILLIKRAGSTVLMHFFFV
jgi:hypothetical protein